MVWRDRGPERGRWQGNSTEEEALRTAAGAPIRSEAASGLGWCQCGNRDGVWPFLDEGKAGGGAPPSGMLHRIDDRILNHGPRLLDVVLIGLIGQIIPAHASRDDLVLLPGQERRAVDEERRVGKE